MNNPVFFSICIPAYKNSSYVSRLLTSIASQSFKNYEVIVSDDSPDDSVEQLISNFAGISNLHYFKNRVALGTPQNWNAAISKAKGTWIKLMHDDDWFVDGESLQHFAREIEAHPQCSFFYAAYVNVDLKRSSEQAIQASVFRRYLLRRDPITLLSKNIIGPPSVTVYRNNNAAAYDRELKWLVDIDFYVRYLKTTHAHYCSRRLVNIGLSEIQVTRSSSMVPEVEVPEYLTVMNKMGDHCFKNVLVYDACWRMLRNMRISGVDDIVKAGYWGRIPPHVMHMIDAQKKAPGRLLFFGPLSKLIMFVSYLLNVVVYRNR